MLTNFTRRAAKRTTNLLAAAALVLGAATLAQAQGGLNAGKKGITDATTAIAAYFDSATLLIYAIAAIIGLVGAVKVFSMWNSGDQNAQKSAMSWFGSCIFLVVVSTVLRAMFL